MSLSSFFGMDSEVETSVELTNEEFFAAVRSTNQKEYKTKVTSLWSLNNVRVRQSLP